MITKCTFEELRKNKVHTIVFANDDPVHTGETSKEVIAAMHDLLFEYIGEDHREGIHIETCSLILWSMGLPVFHRVQL